MRHRYLFAAEIELRQFALWHENRQETLGDNVYEEADRMVVRVLAAPEGFKKVAPKIRRINAKPFRLSMLFRIIDDEAVIIGVFDGGSDPKSWRKMLSR